MLPTKFRFIWLSGFKGENSNVKSWRTTDDGRQVMAKASYGLVIRYIYLLYCYLNLSHTTRILRYFKVKSQLFLFVNVHDLTI
jgi:hypothetical protein